MVSKRDMYIVDYAMIPFNMERVKAQTSRECKVIEDYEELKEWWENEE